MTINKQNVLDGILAEQQATWAENRKSYPKTEKRSSVLGVHKPSETENAFHDFQTKMNAKINAEKACLKLARQLTEAESKADQYLLISELKASLNKLDQYEV